MMALTCGYGDTRGSLVGQRQCERAGYSGRLLWLLITGWLTLTAATWSALSCSGAAHTFMDVSADTAGGLMSSRVICCSSSGVTAAALDQEPVGVP